MTYDLESLNSKAKSTLLLSIVLPRPVAIVTSLNADGTVNIAPFSLFNLVSLDPPIAYISIQKTTPPKRTATNIKEAKEFVINIPNYDIAENMNMTASPTLDGKIDKFESCGFTKAMSQKIKTCGINESLIRLECKLHNTIDFSGYEMFLGEIISIFCDDSVLEDNNVSIDKHEFISRLGPKELYSKIESSSIFIIKRYEGNIYEG